MTTTARLTRLTLLALALLITLTLTIPSWADARTENTRPTARPDYYAVNEDTSLRIGKVGGVLKNDSDRQTKSLSAKLSRAPYHGRLTLAKDGSFLYTPNANYHGSDSFRYTACETSGTKRLCSWGATVSINVNSVNDGPDAIDDKLQTSEDTALNIASPGLLGNDRDIDGDTLKIMGAAAATGPSNGTLTLTEDGGLIYKPNPNYKGTDTFTYKASDGSRTDTATVTIQVSSVNDAPVARGDRYLVRKNTPKTVGSPGVLANDYDPDGDAISVVGYSQSTKGKVGMNGSGGFIFRPNKDYTGTTHFRYYIRDANGATASQIVTLRVY